MRSFRFLTTGAALALLAASPLAAQQPTPNETARFLAGLPQQRESGLSSLERSAAWQQHQAQSAALWRQWNQNRSRQMRQWAEREAAHADPAGRTLFYPFSGPDIPSALAFFPNAGEYILIGLEPVGPIPRPSSIAADSMAPYLANIRKATTELIQLSFFRTNDMAVDLGRIGVLPVLMLSLAQGGYEVRSVRMIEIAADGRLQPRTADGVPGVEVRFARRGGREQVVRYFSLDLSDNGLGKTRGAQAYLNGIQGATTFLKAASYLMHKPYFSRIRTTILERSGHVLQDDSGVPFRFFPAERWAVQLYGTYTAPITLFDDWRQADLQTAYETRARALPFGIGYRHRPGTSNLMLATRRAPTAPPATR